MRLRLRPRAPKLPREQCFAGPRRPRRAGSRSALRRSPAPRGSDRGPTRPRPVGAGGGFGLVAGEGGGVGKASQAGLSVDRLKAGLVAVAAGGGAVGCEQLEVDQAGQVHLELGVTGAGGLAQLAAGEADPLALCALRAECLARLPGDRGDAEKAAAGGRPRAGGAAWSALRARRRGPGLPCFGSSMPCSPSTG